jgi:CubicO group peptidase (beta-lactamase class C family)
MNKTDTTPVISRSKCRATAITLLAISCLVIGLFSYPARGDEQPRIATIQIIARDAMKQYHLKALIVRVTSDGKNVYTAALGESMAGVPATRDMHFRNGAMAFTYMATMLLEFVDQKKVKLDDKLAKFFPELPSSDRITLKELANMTSGYADYVYQPEVMQGYFSDPFRQWRREELIHIGTSKPKMFDPGSNFGYSHTNYVILGCVLEKIAGMPLRDAMQKYIFGPMNLTQTRSSSTPQIPEPVLHVFTSERRADLHIPSSTPFYEEATFWNPSWTTAEGAIQTTDIADLTTTMEAVGTGKILSKASFAAQVGPNLVGHTHVDPSCPANACLLPNTVEANYGLGVINLGPWITQFKGFSGNNAAVGYLPAKKLAIAVTTTYEPAAFDDQGLCKDASKEIFMSLSNVLAPGTLPKSKP